MDIFEFRNEYLKGGLSRADLDDNPFKQFEKWFNHACECNVTEPNAMVVSTVSAEGAPSSRVVLLKSWDEKGFVFYTNYTSRKAREIAENNKVCAVFTWLDLERQLRIEGIAEKVSAAESLRYFLSRPFGSRLGAWVSRQSSVISSRSLLEMQFEKMKEKFKNGEVPLPDFWGGYRIVPSAFEFWQGRQNRLHDRFGQKIRFQLSGGLGNFASFSLTKFFQAFARKSAVLGPFIYADSLRRAIWGQGNFYLSFSASAGEDSSPFGGVSEITSSNLSIGLNCGAFLYFRFFAPQ